MIPCHRVVGSNGSLTGYAGGIDKKIRLLAQEGVDMSKLSVPESKMKLCGADTKEKLERSKSGN